MTHRQILATLMGALLVVVTAGTAWADTVNNDVASSDDTVSIVAGSSATVNFKIVASSAGETPSTADKGPNKEKGAEDKTPVERCNPADGSPATVTFQADPAVTVPAPLSFVACNEPQPAEFTSEVPGRYAVSVVVTDTGTDDGYHTTPADFTLVVTAAPVVVRPPVDTTPPVVAYSVTGTEGNDGWYVSDVELDWSVSEPESPLSLVLTGCEDQAITTDQNETTYSCSASSAGGTSAESATIKRDATAPVSTVTGIDSPFYYTGGSPPPAVVGCSDTDVTSGVAKASTPSEVRQLNANGVGRVTWTCSGATDQAGNRAADAVKGYEILYGGISGILQPIASGSTTKHSRGKSVPVKFRVAGDEPAGFVVTGWSVERQVVGCAAPNTPLGAPVAVGSNSSSGLRYDPAADHYIYNADLRDAPVGSCLQLRGRFDNGQTTPWSGVLSLTK